MAQGTIKKLTSKGFGFIEGAQGDLFFHQSEVQGARFDELREGQSVQYTVASGPKGPCANAVQVVQ